ncbi:MAG: helix-turn-helix domain-containing protein [Magnetococcales bacterium]|nr:helix-turn-helix domain-containing protein [Magnetococcales bacterium]
MSTPLGDKVRKLRKSKGMTLEQLGTATGSSKSYIWTLENQTPPRPSADKIQRIAAILGVTSEYLMDEGGATSPEEEVLDKAFFRKFQQMDSSAKKKIRRMIDLWDDDE